MSNKRITQLPSIDKPLQNDDEFAVVQDGVTKKIKKSNIPAFKENQEILFKRNIVADNEDIRRYVNNDYDRNSAGNLYDCRTGAQLKVVSGQVQIYNYTEHVWDSFSPSSTDYLDLNLLIPDSYRQMGLLDIRIAMGLQSISGVFIYNTWLNTLVYLGSDGTMTVVGYRHSNASVSASSSYPIRFAQQRSYGNGCDEGGYGGTLRYSKIMGSMPTAKDVTVGLKSDELDPQMVPTNSIIRSATIVIPECATTDNLQDLPQHVYVRFEIYRIDYDGCTLLKPVDVPLDSSLVRNFVNGGAGSYDKEPIQTVIVDDLDIVAPAGSLIGVVVHLRGGQSFLNPTLNYVEKLNSSQIILNVEAQQ